MSKTVLTQIATYVDSDEVRRLDALRGGIPRARVMNRALLKFIAELENGKESLLPGPQVTNQAQTAATSSSFASHNIPNPGGSTRKGDAG